MKKALALIIATITIIGCFLFNVGCEKPIGGPDYFFDDQEFNTKYTAEEHEQRIIESFNSVPDTTCYEVKVVYSLKEEHRFFIVHYSGLSARKEGIGERYEEGFIYNEKYYLMDHSADEKIKKLFEEYKDEKLYHFRASDYAYENENGKKIYIEADKESGERFKKHYLGGQSEVKKKYYKKISACVMHFNIFKIGEQEYTKDNLGFSRK